MLPRQGRGRRGAGVGGWPSGSHICSAPMSHTDLPLTDRCCRRRRRARPSEPAFGWLCPVAIAARPRRAASCTTRRCRAACQEAVPARLARLGRLRRHRTSVFSTCLHRIVVNVPIASGSGGKSARRGRARRRPPGCSPVVLIRRRTAEGLQLGRAHPRRAPRSSRRSTTALVLAESRGLGTRTIAIHRTPQSRRSPVPRAQAHAGAVLSTRPRARACCLTGYFVLLLGEVHRCAGSARALRRCARIHRLGVAEALVVEAPVL